MYILYSMRIKLQLNINLVWFFVLMFTGLLNYFPLLAVVSPLLCLSLVLSKLSRDWIWNTTFLNNQIMSSRFLLGVSNGPIQFESARKMWPLLELLAKIMHLSMLSPRVGRGGATHGNLIQRAFPWVGILILVAAPGSGIWHVRHLGRPREPGNKSSTIIPTYLTINLVLKLFVFHLSLFLFPFNTLFLNHNCKYYISTIYHLLNVICIYLNILFFFF